MFYPEIAHKNYKSVLFLFSCFYVFIMCNHVVTACCAAFYFARFGQCLVFVKEIVEVYINQTKQISLPLLIPVLQL